MPHGHAVRDETLSGVRHVRCSARPPLLHDGHLHHETLDEALYDRRSLRLSSVLRQRRHLSLRLSNASDGRVPGAGGTRLLLVRCHQFFQAGVRVRDQHDAVQRRDHFLLCAAPGFVCRDRSLALLRPRRQDQGCRAQFVASVRRPVGRSQFSCALLCLWVPKNETADWKQVCVMFFKQAHEMCDQL